MKKNLISNHTTFYHGHGDIKDLTKPLKFIKKRLRKILVQAFIKALGVKFHPWMLANMVLKKELIEANKIPCEMSWNEIDDAISSMETEVDVKNYKIEFVVYDEDVGFHSRYAYIHKITITSKISERYLEIYKSPLSGY